MAVAQREFYGVIFTITTEMHVIRKNLAAGREARGIGDDISVFVPADLPAIIDNNILVASFFHAFASHRIGHRLNQIFADVAGKLVPTVPSHGRSRGKGVSFGLSQGTAGAENHGEERQQPGATIVRKALHRVTSKDFSIR